MLSKILYSKYSNERSERFQIRTDIIEDDQKKRLVRKSPYTEKAQEHIDNIYEHYRRLNESYRGTKLTANTCWKENNSLLFEYVSGKTLEEELDVLLQRNDYLKIIEVIQEFFDMVKMNLALEMFEETEQFVQVFGEIHFPKALMAGSFNNIDYVFANIILQEEHWTVIDYEWTFDFPIPIEFIIYRAVHYYTYDLSRKKLRDIGILEILGIDEQMVKCFELMEHRFQLYILGGLVPIVNMYKDIAGPSFSLKTMLDKDRENFEKYKIQIYYDYGQGYSEENTESMYPHTVDYDKTACKHRIEVRENVKAVRIDPGERCCWMNELELLGVGSSFEAMSYTTNGCEVVNGSYVFATTDPQIVIPQISEGIHYLDVSYNLEFLSAKAAANLVSLFTREKSQRRRIESLVAELSDMKEIQQGLEWERKNVQELRAVNQGLNEEIRHLNLLVQDLEHRYQEALNSFSLKVTKPLRWFGKAVKKVLKSNKVTYKLARGMKCLIENGFVYTFGRTIEKITGKIDKKEETWEINRKELKRQRRTAFKKKIKFSIVVPLYNTPPKFLIEMIESVQAQSYRKWELCLADGSDNEHADVKVICEKYAKKDSRIRYKKLDENLGISENTNRCIEMATGDYIALFDHDDLLHPSALYENMCIIDDRDADFIYSDENTFTKTPKDAYCPHYKPDYSPDTLRSYNYICHFSVFKRSLLDKVGMFRKEFDGSQDYDMILRLTEKAKVIAHIPKIIYYWRAHGESVASDISAKTYCLDAARKALTEHLRRVGLKGRVLDAAILSIYKIEYDIAREPLVSILIPNKDYIEDLSKCLDSILQKSTYSNYEIIIIENNSELESTFEYYERIQKNKKIKVVKWTSEFNYSAINNFGFGHSKGEVILLLNNDMEVISENWIQEMLMFAQRKDVGAVGAKLYYPDDTVQHAGVILGLGGVAGHSHKYFARDAHGYFGRLLLAQNLSCVTAACLMVRREVYEDVGGLDEGYQIAFNDVDFCMKIRKAGYLNVFTPFAELYHYESKSRGYENTEEKVKRFNSEIDRFHSKWSRELAAGDPYYNLNLTLCKEDFSLK